jgi:adenylate cyclase
LKYQRCRAAGGNGLSAEEGCRQVGAFRDRSTMSHVDLELLGPIRVLRRAGEQIELPSRSGYALLLYLALHHAERHSRERLALLLWPDRGQKEARHSLRQSLFACRQALAPLGLELICAEGEEVWIAPTVNIDVREFAKLAREGSDAALHAAISLYRGELAAGFRFRSEPFERWLAAERIRLREAACSIMSRLVAQFSKLGDLEEAIRINRKLVEADSSSEEAHRSLMRLLAAAGRHEAALDQYRECASAMRRLLDEEPGPETRKLVGDIRARAAQELAVPKVREVEPRVAPLRSGPPNLRLPARAFRLLASGAVAAMLIGLAGWHAFNRDGATPDAAYSLAPPPARSGSNTSDQRPAKLWPLSLVVLPFANLTDDRRDEWFADAITEELTIDLARIPDALVIARSSAFTYKGKFVDPRQIGRELSVRYLVEGSVWRDAEQVRLLVQVADAQSGNQIWSERYVFERANLNKTLDLTLAGVARAIQLNLEDSEGKRLARQRPLHADAVELVMQARAVLNTGSRDRLTAAKEAASLLERATAIDASSVSAWALLGIARASQVLGKGHDRREPSDQVMIASAEQAASRALALDSKSVIALLAMGQVKRMAWQADEAIHFYERARASNPHYAPLLGELARSYALTGRAADAVPLYDLAIRLSPKDPALRVTLSNRCSAKLMLKRYADAVADCESAMKLGRPPDNLLARLALAHLWAGNRQRALEIASDYRKREPNLTVRSCKSLNHPSNHPSYRAFVDRGCNAFRELGFPE